MALSTKQTDTQRQAAERHDVETRCHVAYIRKKVATTETGIAVAMIPVALQERRKRKSTRTARTPPIEGRLQDFPDALADESAAWSVITVSSELWIDLLRARCRRSSERDCLHRGRRR